MKRYLSFSFFLTVHLAVITGQNALNGVVKIVTHDESGSERETGAGILMGQMGNTVFIATALHVVEDATSIGVQFNELRWTTVPARIYSQTNSELDLAVVVVQVPAQAGVNFYKFRKGNIDVLENESPVGCIGHPFGAEWTYNKLNMLDDAHYSTHELRFTALGIEPGFSGGALVDRKKNNLLGLITRIQPGASAIAVSIDEVMRNVTKWGLPVNFIQPYKAPLKKSTFVFGALSVGAFTGGLVFNAQGVDQYNIYKTNRDETAPIFSGTTREDLLEKARQDYTYRNISYGVAGAFALTAALCNLIKIKKDKKSKPVNDGIPDFYGRVGFSSTGAQVGFSMKF